MPNGLESARSSFEHGIIIDFVIFAANVVLNFIAANFTGLHGFLVRMTDTIIGVITSNNAALAKTVKSVVGIAEKNILDGILDVDATVVRAEETILTEVGINTDLLGIVVGALHDGINVEITNEIEVTDSLFGTLLSSVKDILDGNVSGIGSIVKSLNDQFGDIFDGLLDVLGGTLLDQIEVLEKIWAAIFKGVDVQVKTAEVLGDESDKGLGSTITKSVFGGISDKLGVTVEQLEAAVQIVDLDEFAHTWEIECKDDALLLKLPETDVGKWLYKIVAEVITTFGWFGKTSGAFTARCFAEWSADNPWKILEAGDIARMRQLGLVDTDDAIRAITMSGYTKGDAGDLLSSVQTIPTFELLLTMWLRGFLTDDALDFALGQSGYNEAFSKNLKGLAFFIPPVQDLITMSVREVFSPEIRARNQQDANFPPDFLKWALQQGVSEEWARNYWAAHWVLPSVQMGFEMLHRREIDEPRLRELMQALDIMPGWVDQIIAISFTPITRVDIRRLNRLGFLEGQELRNAYRDIGYNVDNAEKLSAFTEELNKTDEVFTLDVASDLSRSSIIGFYKDGIIGKAITLALMIQAGINAAAAGLFIAAADFDLERADRKQRIDLVFDQFRAGALNFDEAADRLAGLGLETIELQLVRLDLERLDAQQTKLPSRGDLDRFVKANIIERPEYMDMMGRLGFSRRWSRRYFELASAA